MKILLENVKITYEILKQWKKGHIFDYILGNLKSDHDHGEKSRFYNLTKKHNLNSI